MCSHLLSATCNKNWDLGIAFAAWRLVSFVAGAQIGRIRGEAKTVKIEAVVLIKESFENDRRNRVAFLLYQWNAG